MKKKAIKIAAASAVAASAFVASAPLQSNAASNVGATVDQAVNQMKAAYHTYSDVTTDGTFADLATVYKQYNAAKVAYANATAAVKKAGGAQKDAYLAKLDSNYNTLIKGRVVTYIDAYKYAKSLEGYKKDLADALTAKEWNIAEAGYHKISYELKTRTVILDRVYGKTARELLRSEFKASAQTLRDSIAQEVTAKIALAAAQSAVDSKDLAVAKAQLDKAATALGLADKDSEFTKALVAQAATVNAAYEALVTPAVESVSAINSKQIVIKFNKPVFSADAVVDQTGADAQNPANYTLNSAPATKAELSSDKKSVTLTFASAESDNKVLVVEQIATPAKDKDGNVIKTEKYSQVFSYTDTVAPTVVGTSYANGKITLEFSEAVATLPTVVRVNGTPVDASNIAAGATANKVDVTYALTTGTTANLYVAGAKDAAATPNEMPLFNGTVIAPAADTGKPQVVGVQVTGQNTAKVTLSEAVNETSIVAKLQKSDTQTAVTLEKDLTDTTGKTYTLTVDLNGAGTAGDGIFSGTSTSESFTLYVAAGAMHDLATTPNANDLFSTNLTFNKDVKAPSFVSSQVSSDNQKLEFKFDEDLTVVGSDANIVIKNGDGVKIAAVAAETDLKTGDAKTYQVDTKATAVALDAGTYTVTLPAGFFTDAHGNQSAAVTSTFTVGTASSTDTTKPTAVVTNLSGATNTFEVTYNEEVSSSALSLSNYQLDGKSLPAGTEIYFTDTTKKIVDIVLPANSINIGNQADGAKSILTVSGVADKAGNVINAFNTSVVVKDNTAATITGVQVIGQDVYVTFNEDVTVPTTTDADLAFDLTVNNVAVTAGEMSAVTGNAKQVKFTLDNAPASTPVVKVKAGQTDLTDANGVAVK